MGKSLRAPGSDLLAPIEGPELVFGLVAPIGTDLSKVERILADELKKVKYESIVIKLTSLLKEIPLKGKVVEEPLEKRYHSYIKQGNAFRRLPPIFIQTHWR